ncbi:MAG: efflux RND transporter periplasmic adaptor subunit [Ferrimonas sp.]
MRIGLLWLGILALSGCQPEKAVLTPVSNNVSVQTQAAKWLPSYLRQHRLVGQIRHRHTANLGFELSGVIATVNARLGQQVQAGALLAQLDTSLLHTEAKQLQANLEQLKACLTLNQSTYDRQQQLQQNGFQAQQQIDELTTEKQSLQAQLQQVQAALEANQLRIQKSQLQAPFAGTVSQLNLATGQVVGAGQSGLTLVPNQGADAHIGVPVALFDVVHQPNLSRSAAAQLHYQQQQLPAIARGHSAAIDPHSRTVEFRFDLPDKPVQGAWLDGDLIYLELQQNVAEKHLKVPLTALINGQRGRWNLLVAVPHEQSWQLQRRDVQILHSDDQFAMLTGAIHAGEQLVIQGLAALVAGQQVHIAEVAP